MDEMCENAAMQNGGIYNMSSDKTNVMRILDQKKIKYKVHEYKDSGAVSGVEVAAALGQDPKRAFKTLVTIKT